MIKRETYSNSNKAVEMVKAATVLSLRAYAVWQTPMTVWGFEKDNDINFNDAQEYLVTAIDNIDGKTVWTVFLGEEDGTAKVAICPTFIVLRDN